MMTPNQEAFLARARAQLRELEALRQEAQVSLTSDDFTEVDHQLMLRLDDIRGAMTRALRGQQASLNMRPGTRYTVYRLDLPVGRWLRLLTTRDPAAAVRFLIEQQGAGEIAHFVAWQSLADRAAQEGDATRFRPQLGVADAADHVIKM